MGNLPKNFIVLDFEEEEYLTLYKVSENEKKEDHFIYGAEVRYDNDGKMKIGKLNKIFNSFEEFFEDFIKLAD